MSRLTRQTVAGRAYLDLQNRARREGRGTQELLTLYVVERWLARLAESPYRDQFVLKGGMLLAAFDARRPTADADALARGMSSDEATVTGRITMVARWPVADDGVEFRPETMTSRLIRDDAVYSGLRVSMDTRLGTANVKFRLDVNFGDPVTPAPRVVDLPSLRRGEPPVRVLGYPIETILAEKVATAIALGAANTRVRDYADVYILTGRYDLPYEKTRAALLATAGFRGTALAPLTAVVDNLVDLRRATYAAYKISLGSDGNGLPADFGDVVSAVAAYADPLIASMTKISVWNAGRRRWES
jgi:hypothetical protein